MILTTVSGFGSFGPQSHYESSHLISCAVGGWCHLCGVPEREPLQVGGNVSETLTGAFAAAATQLAVVGRARHGRGEHIDASVQQAVLAGAQIPTMLYEYRGLSPERYSSVGSGAGACYMLPTADGYIGLNALTRPQWHMLCDFLGRKDIAENPRYQSLSWVNPDERLEEVREAFQTALADRTADELFHEAEKWRVPFGLVPDMAGMFALPPHRHRGFIVPLEHPTAGEVEVPGVPFRATATEPRPFRPPLLGEHTEEILSNLPAAPTTARQTEDNEASPLPLEGVRVLDLSMFFAGPVCAQIAADAGADVIKVESIQRIDGWRGSATGGSGELPSWESSPYFNWVNRNKRDVTLNLTDPRGVDIVKTMARDADILIENYTPRVMAKFGLSWETLHAINPRLVMISLSGFGADSPWRDYVAFGMSTEQMGGFTHLTGYPDGDPLFTGTTGGDLFAGVMGANALFAALQHRDRTGEGQHIDCGQVESCSLYVGDAMTAWSLAGVDPGRVGNGHHHYPLQGVYPCAGNRWIAITCKSRRPLPPARGTRQRGDEWRRSRPRPHRRLDRASRPFGLDAGPASGRHSGGSGDEWPRTPRRRPDCRPRGPSAPGPPRPRPQALSRPTLSLPPRRPSPQRSRPPARRTRERNPEGARRPHGRRHRRTHHRRRGWHGPNRRTVTWSAD